MLQTVHLIIVGVAKMTAIVIYVTVGKFKTAIYGSFDTCAI